LNVNALFPLCGGSVPSLRYVSHTFTWMSFGTASRIVGGQVA